MAHTIKSAIRSPIAKVFALALVCGWLSGCVVVDHPHPYYHYGWYR